MNTPSTLETGTATSQSNSLSTPVFYQLSWENWTDDDGSFHKKILGAVHQIKKSEDGTAIAGQDFFLAGKDASGHDLFVARELSDPSVPAASGFLGNYLSTLNAAGEYHPVDITNCGRMVDMQGNEKTITSGYQVLMAKTVEPSTLTNFDNVFVLDWIDWDPTYTVLSKMNLFQSGVTAENVAIYPCRALLDTSKPERGHAIGSYLQGAKAANVPVKDNALSRTSFQLLQATPMALHMGREFSISSPAASDSVSSSSHILLGKRKSPATPNAPSTSQEMRNIMGALMAQVVYQATGYNPTSTNADTPSTGGLNKAPFTTSYFMGEKYSLTFNFEKAKVVGLIPGLGKSISPDRYVIFSSESQAASYVQGNIYLGFAGTRADFSGEIIQSISDWLLNGMLNQVTYPINSMNAQAHNGFMLATAACAGIEGLENGQFAFNLRNPLFSQISSLVDGFKEKDYKQVNLYIGGHSQGGAVATLIAPILKSLLEDQYGTEINICTEVYTYGAPRSCNGALAANYLDMVDACYRYQNEGDPVPFVPPGKHGLLAAAFNIDAFIEQLFGDFFTSSQLTGILAKHHQFMSDIREEAESINLDPTLNDLLKQLVGTVTDAGEKVVEGLPKSTEELVEQLKSIGNFLVEKVLSPIASFLAGHPIAQTINAIMDGIGALMKGFMTTTLPQIIQSMLVPVYLLFTAIQLVIETINKIPGVQIPDLTSQIANMEAMFKKVYGNLGSSTTHLLAFFYKLSMLDYVHVGRLQAIVSADVEDGTGQVMFNQGSFFASLYSKNEHLALAKFDFANHNMSAYVDNLKASIAQ